MAIKNRHKEIRICATCGAEFYPQVSGMATRGIYCSRKCFIGNKRNKIKVNCNTCGIEFYPVKSRIKKCKRIYCSKHCAGIGYSKNMAGENSHTWQGGITPTYEKIRSDYKNKTWRQNIFIRDNFTCQKCGDRSGGNLRAHHIKCFSLLMNEVKEYMPLLPLYDAAIAYAPLWDINNGVALCEKCHIEEHRRKKK